MQVSSLLADDPGDMKRSQPAKSVSFELLLDEKSKTRARIPLRVVVNLHDSTESIITTVKNFYGIYDGNGVSFEDGRGNTLIASYDNLTHDSTVYVRSMAGPIQAPAPLVNSPYMLSNPQEVSRHGSLGEPFQMLPPRLREGSHSPSRSSSRVAHKRSVSPQRGRARRSASQQKNGSYAGSRGSSANGSQHEDNAYSDSETSRSSMSTSRRMKNEHFASSDISTANVLLDGRRGQPIFDSSTLPLFAPPQVAVTASQSSISPQRRSLPHDGPSPFQLPAQKLYDMSAPPLLSPQSHNTGAQSLGSSTNSCPGGVVTPASQHSHRLRDRHSCASHVRGGYGSGHILPTPDPTVASCISDEDVARTLIALGDVSNFSHGRTSTSTIDDTFSGAADAASSTGATSDSDEYSDSEGGLPKHRKFLDDGDDEYESHDIVKSEFDEVDGPPKTKKIKTKTHDGPSTTWRGPGMGLKTTKSGKGRAGIAPKVIKVTGPNETTKAPAAQPVPVRKTSSTPSIQHQLAADEEDLSTKPRCQRCRKSKKGCDRQRPCQRCKDAGIGIEGCVSEDEGNGRKGRYGRHMGVPVKKLGHGAEVENELDMPMAISIETSSHGSPSKKRKR